ncbi:MAG: hypothetical protein SXA11_16810 [Cyanobacteriota bacterium]|nr:hypothetical protein [Cyanobacteriota bacterium]
MRNRVSGPLIFHNPCTDCYNRRDACSTETGETPVLRKQARRLRKQARRLFYGNRRDACSTETGETPVLRF